MSKDEEHLRGILAELFGSQGLGVLATHNEGQPYTSLVAFAATEDLRYLLFATTRETRKFSNIRADSRVAMLVDSRMNQEADFHKAVAATATGVAEEVEGAERNHLLTLYLARHPHLRAFVTAPSCALLRIRVDTYYVVSRFQHVMELHLSP
jgi:nitroimidazol reductase NimA-like FMN-containing flavoprotein (pyridoxamine 5'-phosphate oxidase superfamily)